MSEPMVPEPDPAVKAGSRRLTADEVAEIEAAVDRVVARFVRHRAILDPDELRQEAWSISLGCVQDPRGYDPARGPLRWYLGNVLPRHLGRHVARLGAPVSLSKGAATTGVGARMTVLRVRRREDGDEVRVVDGLPSQDPSAEAGLVDHDRERARQRAREVLQRCLARVRGPGRRALQEVLRLVLAGETVPHPADLAERAGLSTRQEAHRAFQQFRDAILDDWEARAAYRDLVSEDAGQYGGDRWEDV